MSRRERGLFERHSNTSSYDEMSTAEVVGRCERIIEALKPWVGKDKFETRYGQGALPIEAIPALKVAIPLVENMDRHLPSLMAWSVGYWWGSDGTSRSTFFGCMSEAQANRLCEAANEADKERKRRVGDKWTVEFMAVEYGDMVKRTFSAEEAAEVVRGL